VFAHIEIPVSAKDVADNPQRVSRIELLVDLGDLPYCSSIRIGEVSLLEDSPPDVIFCDPRERLGLPQRHLWLQASLEDSMVPMERILAAFEANRFVTVLKVEKAVDE
jgi:hypothetical protein